MDLVRFLKITDVDALNQAYSELPPLSERDQGLILKVIQDWKVEQAIANILFYPRLIPSEQRYEVLHKALRAEEAPYYVLAAVVGLQTIDHDQINKADKTKIALQLMDIMQSDADIIASRASISIWEYLDERSIPLLLQLYPVDSESANRNIIALTLQYFQLYNKRQFNAKLKEYKISWWRRRTYVKHFGKYLKGKKTGFGMMEYAPVYDPIPNLNDVDQRAEQAVLDD